MRSTSRLLTSVTILILSCFGSRALAQPDTCPTPPNLVKATATATVTFDPGTSLYTYQYTVASDPNSQQEVSGVAIDFAPPVQNVATPNGWSSGTSTGRNTILWAATAPAPVPAGVTDVGQLFPGQFQIKPGNSLSGFSFQSPNPPGPVNSYVLGFADLGTADSEGVAEAIVDSCPQSVGGFFDLAVVASTQGPVQFIPVQIDIKPGSSPTAINPKAQGVIPVAILSSSSFDATKVDPTTVRFGPASAVPTDSGHVEDVNNDGLADLLFQFPTPATGIVCGDTSETLTGKTLNGTQIRGSQPVVTVDCKK